MVNATLTGPGAKSKLIYDREDQEWDRSVLHHFIADEDSLRASHLFNFHAKRN